MSESACPTSAKPPVVNAMTVDVEDYFHVSVFEPRVPRTRWNEMERRVVANTTRLLDLFAEFDVRATFFVLGWVAEHEPALVRRIAAHGHEIGSHGYAHRLIYQQTPEAFREDVRRAKDLLENLVGKNIGGYRAPSFSITEQSLWALDILMEEGHWYDSSIFPIRHDRYGIPASPRLPFEISRNGRRLQEFPASTLRFHGINLPIAGGGYFRILPYAWTRWGIGRLNARESASAVFYVHPWEVDPQQPRLPAGWLGRFRHYWNLSQTESRLRALLGHFSFDTMASVLRGCGTVGHPWPTPSAPALQQ